MLLDCFRICQAIKAAMNVSAFSFSNFKNISQRFTKAKVLRRVSHKEERKMKTLNDFKMTKEFCQFTKGIH